MVMLRPGIDLTFEQLLSLQQNRSVEMTQLKPASASLAGRFRSSLKGRGMEFDEVRQYQAGDDIRTIDWRVTARTGKTHTKIFSEERERPVIVVLDLCQSMRFGSQLQLKSYQAATLAAQLLWTAKTEGDRFGALIFNEQHSDQIKPKLRTSNLMQIFSLIVKQHQGLVTQATVQQSNSESTSFIERKTLNENLHRLRHLSKTGALIHLISDLSQFDEQSTKSISLLSRHNQVVTWQIQDPLELSLPSHGMTGVGALAVSDGQRQGVIEPANKRYAKQYQQQASEKQLNLQTKFRQIGVPLLSISTHIALQTQLKSNQLRAVK